MNSPHRILLVEDSRTQASNLSDLLTRQGWTVEWVSTAEEAMRRVHEPALDLIVLDYYLPGMRGDALCQRIRLTTGARDLPILMLTADDTRSAEVRLLESGADDFVAKSADAEILLARIRALLTRSAARQMVLGGAEVPLSPARILTIDDSPTYQEYLATELVQEGFRVERAGCGRDGLARLAAEEFDCAIVDLVMPGLDGIEVCRRINDLGRATNNPIAVLMLTGRESKEDLTRALEAGADDFVSKSADLAVVKGRIRALLRRKLLQAENRRIVEQLKHKELETLRAQAEKEVAQAKAALNDELEQRVQQRTAELAAANHDLAVKSREIETFVYSVSHDLRSPLVNLQGFSNELNLSCDELRGLLADAGLDEQLRARCRTLVDGDIAEAIRFIQSGVKRLATIIDSLLRLSRAGRVEYQWQRVDVEAVVARVVEAMNDTISQRGAQVNVARLPAAWGDPAAVEQIFANLIGNALNYLDPHRPGQIDVGATPESSSPGADPDPPQLTFFVRDNGLGIPDAHAARVFQAFQRLHPERAPGEGMGLAIVRRVVDRHHGRIWFESTPAGGTTFFVSLPVPADGPEPAGAPLLTRAPSAALVAGGCPC